MDFVSHYNDLPYFLLPINISKHHWIEGSSSVSILAIAHLSFSLAHLSFSLMSIPCEARCGRWFTSISSMNSHLSKARSCAWYEAAKLKTLGLDDPDNDNPLFPAPSPPHDPENHSDWENYDPLQDPDVDMEFGPYEDEFHFLPTHDPEPGPQTAADEIRNPKYPILDDDDDQRVVQIDDEAGRIYRHDPPPKHSQVDKDGDSLMEKDGEPNPFFPFASEMDWRVAHWAVKDGPGHNAFNRLLETPGVSKFYGFPLMLSNVI